MPLNKNDTGNPIRGNIPLNAAQRAQCQAVIAALEYADLSLSGTRHTVGTARLDIQNPPAGGGVNLQVQVANYTVAAVVIAATALQERDPVNRIGVVNGAISALNQSLDNGNVWELTGSIP